jgi:acetyl-CoA synthetase
MELGRLLRPRSVAVVGATDRPGSYGGEALLNLRRLGFAGPVHGVNARRDEAHGFPCVPSLADVPGAPDAVVVAIPAAGVPDAVEEIGARGCGGAVVFAAGFAEAPDGAELQARLAAAAATHDLPVCGPNGNGIVSLAARVAMWGDMVAPRPAGPVALVSQSGNLAVNALASRRGLRLHTVVSCGNQAVVDAAEFTAALAGQEGVRSIALYLEDDGDGERWCAALEACARAGVGVAVLKAGASRAGAAAAQAHTGAVAGDQRVFRALAEEAGAAWATDPHDLLELAKALAVDGRRAAAAPPAATAAARSPGPAPATHPAAVRPPGPAPATHPAAVRPPTAAPPAAAGPAGGVAVMTCSGGDSSVAADLAEELGVPLPVLAPATVASLEELLPAAATAANPLDYTALLWHDTEALQGLVRALAADPGVDRVLVLYDEPDALEGAAAEAWAGVLDAVRAAASETAAPVTVASILPELMSDGVTERLHAAGVAGIAGLRSGLHAAAALRAPAGDPARLAAIGAAASRARAARSAGAGAGDAAVWLAEHEAKALLRDAGIAVPAGRLAADPDDAARALDELGGPVALKLSAAALRHKSERGALELGVATPDDARAAFARLQALDPDAAVLVERIAPPGAELLVAARADAVVPALVVGLGGIWTEALADAAVVSLPTRPDAVERTLRSLRGAALLTGGRGRPPADLGAAARLAAAAGDLLLDAGLVLLELNPVLAGPDGAVAVDALAARPAAAAAAGGERGADEAAA